MALFLLSSGSSRSRLVRLTAVATVLALVVFVVQRRRKKGGNDGQSTYMNQLDILNFFSWNSTNECGVKQGEEQEAEANITQEERRVRMEAAMLDIFGEDGKEDDKDGSDNNIGDDVEFEIVQQPIASPIHIKDLNEHQIDELKSLTSKVHTTIPIPSFSK